MLTVHHIWPLTSAKTWSLCNPDARSTLLFCTVLRLEFGGKTIAARLVRDIDFFGFVLFCFFVLSWVVFVFVFCCCCFGVVVFYLFLVFFFGG